ncbi:MAG: ABC-F family ATP-binding cassette domain-containing protein, partial [Phaeodactylibacter sp.]|nr:ABC-F family ATP-binding cassette domain-containing protein [Phaeodactylibacter sp.]
NLLVLDEPTNHLDMLSKDVLKKAIQDYDGTLIVVSHDREFLSGLTNRTIEFRDRQLHNYIGDVNAFLEKRQLDDMRDVELSSKPAKAGAKAAPRKELTYEERKTLMRAISNAEKKVERLEEEIGALEKKMAQPGFYESPDAVKTTQQYQDKQQQLENAMDEWEEAQLAMDEYED